MILKNVSSFLFLIIIIGCSQNKESSYVDDDLVPPKPSLVSYFTVLGEDADKDGVRDDIEIWINENVSDPNLKRALKFRAKNLGLFMTAKSVAEINNLFYQSIDASICSEVLSHNEIDTKNDINLKFLPRYFNNYWRRSHYGDQFSKLESNTYSWGDTKVLHKLKRCKIKFSNLGETMRFFLEEDRYMSGLTNDEIREYEKMVGIQSRALEPFAGQPSLRRKRQKLLREKGAVSDEEVYNAEK